VPDVLETVPIIVIGAAENVAPKATETLVAPLLINVFPALNILSL
jgi:hypothetical protein